MPARKDPNHPMLQPMGHGWTEITEPPYGTVRVFVNDDETCHVVYTRIASYGREPDDYAWGQCYQGRVEWIVEAAAAIAKARGVRS